MEPEFEPLSLTPVTANSILFVICLSYMLCLLGCAWLQETEYQSTIALTMKKCDSLTSQNFGDDNTRFIAEDQRIIKNPGSLCLSSLPSSMCCFLPFRLIAWWGQDDSRYHHHTWWHLTQRKKRWREENPCTPRDLSLCLTIQKKFIYITLGQSLAIRSGMSMTSLDQSSSFPELGEGSYIPRAYCNLCHIWANLGFH